MRHKLHRTSLGKMPNYQNWLESETNEVGKGLVTNNGEGGGGGYKMGGGAASEVLPLRKGGGGQNFF